MSTSKENYANTIPNNFYLAQNYPNPFNPTTTIQYGLPKEGFVTLTIYNMLGQDIVKLVNENKEGGIYFINVDASKLPNEIYFYKLVFNEISLVKKFILLK